MITALLAYLRDGYERKGFMIENHRWGWRLVNWKGELEFVPLPHGWVKPQ